MCPPVVGDRVRFVTMPLCLSHCCDIANQKNNGRSIVAMKNIEIVEHPHTLSRLSTLKFTTCTVYIGLESEVQNLNFRHAWKFQVETFKRVPCCQVGDY